MRYRPIVPVQLDGPHRRPGLLQRTWWFTRELLRDMDPASVLSVAVLAFLVILGLAHIVATIWSAAP